MGSLFTDEEYTVAVFKLFKKLPAVSSEQTDNDYTYEKVREDFLRNCIYVTEEVYNKNKFIRSSNRVVSHIINEVGYDIEKMNRGFYKSFKVAKNKSTVDILIDHLVHYMSTYGKESDGIPYNDDEIYVPNSELKLPDEADQVKLVVVDYISTLNIVERIKKLATSGVAILEEDCYNMAVIANYLDFDEELLDGVKNKELRILLADFSKHLNFLTPVEVLRLIIYRITKRTLIIKSNKLINFIKSNAKYGTEARDIIKDYDMKELASIFYRYKPLWLALKTESSETATLINQLRRLANKYHKPSKVKVLDRITSSSDIDFEEFTRELSKVTVFKKISILNAISYRNDSPTSITYHVRNGKSFATDYENSSHKVDQKIVDTILTDVVNTLKNHVKDKLIYIPKDVVYIAPTSAKRSLNGIPLGSSISLGKEAVIAIHWENLLVNNYESRIDLDLHINSKSHNVGWHSQYSSSSIYDRSSDSIIYTGDMTSAPIQKGGATEAMYLGVGLVDDILEVSLNNYTYRNDEVVPYKFVIDKPEVGILTRDYLISSHTTLTNISDKIDATQKVLGIIEVDKEGNKKFYFETTKTSKSIVSNYDDTTKHVLESIRTSIRTSITLNELLELAGATLVDKPDNCDIDLSLDKIQKDTIFSLFN